MKEFILGAVFWLMMLAILHINYFVRTKFGVILVEFIPLITLFVIITYGIGCSILRLIRKNQR